MYLEHETIDFVLYQSIWRISFLLKNKESHLNNGPLKETTSGMKKRQPFSAIPSTGRVKYLYFVMNPALAGLCDGLPDENKSSFSLKATVWHSDLNRRRLRAYRPIMTHHNAKVHTKYESLLASCFWGLRRDVVHIKISMWWDRTTREEI